MTEADIEEFIEKLDDGEYIILIVNSLITMAMMRTVLVICRSRMRTIQMTYDL